LIILDYGDRLLSGDRLPTGHGLPRRTPPDVIAADAEAELGGTVPEADGALGIDVEDPVAHGRQQPRRLLALLRRRSRRGLGRLSPPPLLVQARGPDGRAHLRDEPFDDLQVVPRVRPSVAHHLHDPDDSPLVLDRDHHRRLHPRRPQVTDLPASPPPPPPPH